MAAMHGLSPGAAEEPTFTVIQVPFEAGGGGGWQGEGSHAVGAEDTGGRTSFLLTFGYTSGAASISLSPGSAW